MTRQVDTADTEAEAWDKVFDTYIPMMKNLHLTGAWGLYVEHNVHDSTNGGNWRIVLRERKQEPVAN